jgi:TetR/AcrR family transcriptional repressor of nem operon
MEKYQFRRGCLVGNLLQEAPLLPDTFPGRLKAILAAWESRVARCLHEAQAAGAIASDASPDALAQVFWIGWEGAVMRARLSSPPHRLTSTGNFCAQYDNKNTCTGRR